MKLAIDATYSLGREPSGVGIYCRELLHGLAEHHPEQRFQWMYRPRPFLRSFGGTYPRNVSRSLLWDGPSLRRGLFHGLNQRVPRSRYPLQVSTFHDLFVLTGDYSTPEFRRRFAKQAIEAARQSDRIIAVSQFTASQVQSLLGVEPGRIRVVRHGVRPQPSADIVREKVVLSVGAIQTRKNTARLIAAFRAMPSDWRLVLAGSAGFQAQQVLENVNDPRVVVTGYLPQERLSDWYRRATIFAFPSLDEGFGMPILEAMAFGLPVITSQSSAMPEVAGGAAMLVDPLNTEEIASALLRLSQDSELRSQLIKLGRQRILEFTWQQAAEQTWAVYQELTSLPQPRS